MGPSINPAISAKVISKNATVGTPMPLTVWADDDALYSSGGNGPMAGARPAVSLVISKYRGPGNVTLGPGRITFETLKGGKPLEPYSGKTTAQMNFSAPGDYLVLVTANDYSGNGGGGSGCCWTTALIQVAVKAAGAATNDSKPPTSSRFAGRMSTSTHSQTGARTSPRYSLSWRLTVTLILIGVTVMLLFGWAADKQVEMSLLRAGADRAKTATTVLADMLERSMRQSREELRLLASRPDIRAFVANPDNPELPESLRARLNGAPVPGIRRIEIWNDRHLLLEVVRKAPGILAAMPSRRPPSPR
jgi:hypothetical protein